MLAPGSAGLLGQLVKCSRISTALSSTPHLRAARLERATGTATAGQRTSKSTSGEHLPNYSGPLVLGLYHGCLESITPMCLTKQIALLGNILDFLEM